MSTFRGRHRTNATHRPATPLTDPPAIPWWKRILVKIITR